MTLFSPYSKRHSGRDFGFSLIELLVSMSILSVLLLMLTQMLDQIQKTWRNSESRVSQFREARVAFDVITKNLSQASLNTYWDYVWGSDNRVEKYKRQSELHFLTMKGEDLGANTDGTVTSQAIFFQAPLGFSNSLRNLSNLFNARGYYILYGSDELFKPQFIDSEPRYRFRLMEYRPPAEENIIYIDGDRNREGENPSLTEWFRHDLKDYSHPLAENIIALVVAPRDTLEESSEDRHDTYSRIARNYEFDSNTNQDARFVQQLPPLVRVTMVAMDEDSAIQKWDNGSSSMPNLVGRTLFTDTSKFDADVASLKDDLNRQKIGHKVFSTMVAIRSSKWSTFAE